MCIRDSYNKEDIKADGKVIVKADTLLQEMTSDNDGPVSYTHLDVYKRQHIKFDDMDAVTEHFQKKEDADKVAAECQERMCEVEKDDVKEKTVRPPKLYDCLLYTSRCV